MISIVNKEECCGCGSCVQTCPKKCISFSEDEEGFLYPKVNETLCINCGLCEGKCPIINKNNQKKDEIPKAYVAYCKDDNVRIESSSGGIFSVMASKVLTSKGVVVGAGFDTEFLVQHFLVENAEQLDLLRGSKYLQSRTENTYFEVKKLLQKNKYILYIGTACQIEGLNHFLGKEYDNLITIDILCHGVPSPKVWKKYLQELENNNKGKVQYVNFRSKKTGWKQYSTYIKFDNNSVYENVFTNDIYMKLFLSNINLRPSCYDCRFKNINRSSDITIGDCWEIMNINSELDDNKGVSVILVQTEKGKKFLDSIKKDLVIFEEDIDKVLPINSDSRKSVIPHPNRTKFFEQFNNQASFDELEKLIKLPFHYRLINKVNHWCHLMK